MQEESVGCALCLPPPTADGQLGVVATCQESKHQLSLHYAKQCNLAPQGPHSHRIWKSRNFSGPL